MKKTRWKDGGESSKNKTKTNRLPRCKSCHGSFELECENTFLLVVKLDSPRYSLAFGKFLPYTESDWNVPDISILTTLEF